MMIEGAIVIAAFLTALVAILTYTYRHGVKSERNEAEAERLKAEAKARREADELMQELENLSSDELRKRGVVWLRRPDQHD